MGCLMISITSLALASQMRDPAGRWVSVGIAAAVVLPVAVMGVRAGTRGTDDTQRQAVVWCQRHVAPDQLVVEEGWSAPLVSRLEKLAWKRSTEYRSSSAEMRSRFDRLPAHDVVSTPMWVTGVADLPAHGAEPARRMQAIDLDGSYYPPALYAAADYVITSSAVRGRYLR